ncbi:MAG: hypothetical protein M3O23_00125 [Actinomycetota bacterium]|nr:hypothetical protein [Actinomycetota bacterium]
MASPRITRADLESKLREVRGEVEEKGEAAKSTGLTVALAGIAVVVGVAFLLGRRRGRRKSTVVEIRRV